MLSRWRYSWRVLDDNETQKMKKAAIAIAVALAGFATITQAVPKDNTWYIGAKLSWSQYYGADFISNNGPTHESRLDAGTFGGYQVSPYIGSGMGYDWSGRVPYKGDDIDGAYKAQDAQLTTKLGYPITDNLDAYARLGGMVWRTDTKTDVPGDASSKDHDTGVSPVFTDGIKYAITPEIATRLEYQQADNIGNAHTIGTRPNNGVLSLGVSYRFDQGEAAPVVAPAPAPAPEVRTKHFTLKSDVLFSFSKAALKPEGQAALDQLYSQLSGLDPKGGSVVVLGYTDRISSDAYNQGPFERRAQSVVDYLISKGIPADKTPARGMDESSPITGNACDNAKQRVTLIDCLTPDRRIEIEVKGIKDIVTQPRT